MDIKTIIILKLMYITFTFCTVGQFTNNKKRIRLNDFMFVKSSLSYKELHSNHNSGQRLPLTLT